MNFRTELNIPPSTKKINHKDTILLIGSCFSKNIGERLQKYKFKSISNPYGTVFNPVSIAKLIQYTLDQHVIEKKELQQSQGVWVHPDFHSSLCDVNLDMAQKKINGTIEIVHQLMFDVKFLFITLGTVTAYKQKSNDSIVANCHKIPSSSFTKEKIDVDYGYQRLSGVLNQLKKIHPQINIIFTVSPVRHIKDGIIINSRNKASLISMVELLENDEIDISYFPAFEWMMDDLRDYRFYNTDLIHPNEFAIDYIWQKFFHHYFSSDTKLVVEKIDQILQSCNHRPFNVYSDRHQKFIVEVKNRIQEIQSEFPHINFEAELSLLNKIS